MFIKRLLRIRKIVCQTCLIISQLTSSAQSGSSMPAGTTRFFEMGYGLNDLHKVPLLKTITYKNRHLFQKNNPIAYPVQSKCGVCAVRDCPFLKQYNQPSLGDATFSSHGLLDPTDANFAFK